MQDSGDRPLTALPDAVTAIRHARLKPEFAHLYPALEAGVWMTAAEAGAKVLFWQLQQSGADALGRRLLATAHFEFRGGWERGGATDLRTRVTDPDL
jgi:hypothetical protein